MKVTKNKIKQIQTGKKSMMAEDYIFLKKVTKADGAFVTNEMADVMRWDVDPILKYRFLWLGSAVRAIKKC